MNVYYPTRIEVTPSGLDIIRPLQLTTRQWQECCMCWIVGTFGTDYARIQKLFFLVSNYKYLNNQQKTRQGKKNGLETR